MILFLGTMSVVLLGLCVGSFLNSVIWRMPARRSLGEGGERGESPLKGRSHCPLCNHSLLWQDLIPLVSFLFLQGKCRYCNKAISLQYPLVELATAALFILIFWHLSLGLDWSLVHLAYLWTVASLLTVIFVYDLRHYIIPDRFLYPAILVSAIWYLALSDLPPYQLLHTLYSALGAAVFFLTIYLVSRGTWMGFGDVKFAFFMGLFLGWPNILVALFFAFFTGAGLGFFLVLLKKKDWKSQVPFGPFLIIGTFVALFFGKALTEWYLNLFLV